MVQSEHPTMRRKIMTQIQANQPLLGDYAFLLGKKSKTQQGNNQI
jgi:hypothetical protein